MAVIDFNFLHNLVPRVISDISAFSNIFRLKIDLLMENNNNLMNLKNVVIRFLYWFFFFSVFTNIADILMLLVKSFYESIEAKTINGRSNNNILIFSQMF